MLPGIDLCRDLFYCKEKGLIILQSPFIFCRNGELIVSVVYDGTGFDRGAVKNGNGLVNMYKRAEELGAIIIFRSQKNEGTSGSLKCKIT